MNTSAPSGRPTQPRRWFLSLLATRPGRRLLHTTLLATLTLSVAAKLSAPTWAGEDFQVNSSTNGMQLLPVIALNSNGDFVIAWQVDAAAVQTRQFNSIGQPKGNDFRVSSGSYPSVDMANNGDFVVVWENHEITDFGASSIQGQRYNSAGTPQGSQFQVNTSQTNQQGGAAVALDSDGDFVVVWWGGSYGSDNSFDIYGQRYNSAGTPQGSQFQVNNYTTGWQLEPDVALDADGDFVVTWFSRGSNDGDTDYWSVQGQRYDSAGISQGNQFQVNTYTTGQQHQSAVAMDSDGDFVVVWESDGSNDGDTSDWSVQGQRYDSAGKPQGSNFQVNMYTTASQVYPSVALTSNGDFVVVWQSQGSLDDDDDGTSIQGQRYNSAGIPQESQFQVNTYITGDQHYPTVSLDSESDFVVAWQSTTFNTPQLPPELDPDFTIVARRYSPAATDVNLVSLHPAAPTLPSPLSTLLALLSTLLALLTAAYLRLRRSPTP